MEQFQTEGVVLQTFPFKEYDRILTLFTPGGLLKLFVKGRKQNFLQQSALTAPLTIGEYFYIQGRSDLHRFRDGTIFHQNMRIRDNLEALQTANKLIQTILSSQWPGKPSPHLYILFRHFLQKISETEHPQRLIAAFLLKTLKHEGILQLQNICSICQGFTSYRLGGECYCEEHASPQAIFFTSPEEELLQKLATSRSFEEIVSLSRTSELEENIETLFKQAF